MIRKTLRFVPSTIATRFEWRQFATKSAFANRTRDYSRAKQRECKQSLFKHRCKAEKKGFVRQKTLCLGMFRARTRIVSRHHINKKKLLSAKQVRSRNKNKAKRIWRRAHERRFVLMSALRKLRCLFVMQIGLFTFAFREVSSLHFVTSDCIKGVNIAASTCGENEIKLHAQIENEKQYKSARSNKKLKIVLVISVF